MNQKGLHCGDTEGQRVSFPISIKDTNQRNSISRLQSIYPPIGCRNFGKSLSGPTCFNMQFHHHGNAFHTIHSEDSPVRPRIVTVVRPGGRRHPRKITILLNRRSVQTFEQLIADISEALGFPRWKNDRVKKLFSLKGREIRSVSDFFRADDVFVAAGREKLTLKEVQEVLEDLYPDSPYSQRLIQKEWERSQKPKPYYKGSKADSSFGEEFEVAKKHLGTNLERVRAKARQDERVKARKWKKEQWEQEQKELTERKGAKEMYPLRDEVIDKGAVAYAVEHCEKCKREQQLKVHCNAPRERDGSPGKEVQRRGKEQPDDLHSEKKKLRQRCSRTSQENFKEEKEEGADVKDIKKACKERSRRDKEHKEMCPIHGQHKVERKRAQKEENPDTAVGEVDEMHQQNDHNHAEKQSSRAEIRKEIPSKKENPEKSNEKKELHKMMVKVEQWEEATEKIEKEKTPAMTQEKCVKESTNICAVKNRHIKTQSDIESFYETGRTVGDGNFAVVKECKLRNTDALYAMKIIDKAKLKGKEHMIENEISIIKSLSHPNIVRLLEEYETESEIYLIMEFVHGGDLFDAITESVKFTEHNAAQMIIDLCQALAYTHSKNVVHRDLKPENLLVQRNEDGSTTLKLADFGLAMEVTEPIFTVCGTPTYVAPEILSEKGYGLQVDMWATGVILYILLCGFPPFRSLERDQEELFEIIQLGEYEFLSPYWDSISDGAKDLISKLLVVDKHKRYTAQQVLQHPWVRSGGKMNSRNLQREVTMNIERHFKNRRRREHAAEQ
ncbi:serine/threonine-protein kinase DCLK3-like isoform X2 [Polyodon spathula]|uniref:serine/threonine-protein kinase DCLK3-like isoform X2 n=1 Tax=Polyodon spathula TaxID=7913 RepID=UPI001B7F09A6|nr:serine/threonine-protein kinase DCLK3-like isoform X2 [Polyodon spathula]